MLTADEQRRIDSYWQEVADISYFPNCAEGQMGTPDDPAIWIIGIENGSPNKEAPSASIHIADSDDANYSVEMQIREGWRFNRNAFKLLAVLAGEPITNWEKFARNEKVFQGDCAKYLKGNLYPEKFARVDTWTIEAAKRTGCGSKSEYYAKIDKLTADGLQHWVRQAKPRLIIGCGLTRAREFLKLSGGVNLGDRHYWNDNKSLHYTDDGFAPLAVIPHLSGGYPSTLGNDDAGIEYVGNYLREKLARR